jgi:site-specific recombinase XerD
MEKLPPLDFESSLARDMLDYLDYLDHLGFSIVQQAYNLRRIDRFLLQHPIQDLRQLDTRFLMRLMAEDKPRVRANTLRLYCDTLRRFSRYLVRRTGISHNPLEGFPVPRPQPYQPYVFSPQELRLFFDFLKKQTSQAGDLMSFYQALSRYTLYHLLYACGLRVSEAIRLRIKDYSCRQASLYIQPSKFLKDRLIPVSARVCSNLNNLLSVRQILAKLSSSNLLFLQLPQARPYHRISVSAFFRKTLRHLNLYHREYDEQGVRHASPHLHELRRAFALHRLLGWYRQGVLIDAKLPLLATYMGHGYFGHTKTYLTLTHQLLREADRRFAQHFDRLDWIQDDSQIE